MSPFRAIVTMTAAESPLKVKMRANLMHYVIPALISWRPWVTATHASIIGRPWIKTRTRQQWFHNLLLG